MSGEQWWNHHGEARGGRGVSPSWQAVLRRYLSPDEFSRLRALSGEWRLNPFAFDGEVGRFEVAEGWMAEKADEELSEEDLDVVLRACDVLSDHLDELGPVPDGVTGRPEAIGLHFDFVSGMLGPGVDDLAVAERFVGMLRGQENYRLHEEELGGIRRVWVHFDYRSDFEYQSKKSHLDWTLELARHLKEGRPFKGRRLW